MIPGLGAAPPPRVLFATTLLLWSPSIRPVARRRAALPLPALWVLGALSLLAGCRSNATGPSGPPAGITVVDGSDQAGVVGQAVLIAPKVRVRDAEGRAVAGASVKFTVTAGGGSVTGDSIVTDTEGLATVGSWRLGALPGVNTLQARLTDRPITVTISATASPDAPSTIQIVTGGNNLTAVVGQAVTPKPTVRVRDRFGNPIGDSPVRWQVSVGGGTVTGETLTITDAEGRATVGGWTLGPVSGINRLEARTINQLVTTFEAIGIGVPHAVVPVSPQQQDGFIGFAAPKTPRVRVTDAFNANIQGVPVTFAVTAGSGSIIGATVITDADGIAALGDWKLGATTFSEVTATVPGYTGPPTTFRLDGVARPFTIDIRFLNSPPADLRDAYVAGAMRWMEVITGDLPDIVINQPDQWSCRGIALPQMTETIDDMVIFARIGPDDGPGGVLARAGPCTTVERAGTRLTSIGYMQFDVADADLLNNTNRFTAVVAHEMGHVLGLLNDRWRFHGLITGEGSTDPFFTGSQAVAAWPLLGISYSGTPVPIENDGGVGTADSHWRESILVEELMTGWIEATGVPMPLSAVTVGAIADIGYVVNPAAADPYTPGLRGLAAPMGAKIRLNEVLHDAQYTIGTGGRLTPID